jgi:hypothetical protein
MLEVCDYYGVPVIDVFSVSGLNPHLESQADLFDNAKTHPLQWGHNRLGDIVSTRLLCIQRFDTNDATEDDGGNDSGDSGGGDDTGDITEPITVIWTENTALASSPDNEYTKAMNYRTTSDFVEIPTSGLSINLLDDDIEMCVYIFSANKGLIHIMNSYLTERSYDITDYGSGYIKVMVRSKSSPNAMLITAEQAAAGVAFTAL